MKVSKENKIVIYKGNSGKLDVYMNVNNVQYKTTVFPNVEDDMTVRSWGGNVYLNDDTIDNE
ncbi:MAG: hypothetical protein Unbinned96contig1001_2 [Prokaryotic dsDNA virus sp.]|nr:MAG: hypothetical protein Unbinned96contig1001_2 [Prokaryotic dsDNA virus sp.]|tara:strand:+ start:309 stop:494 length:186 start_codon:yes stop_codon:yes gene_type:complete